MIDKNNVSFDLSFVEFTDEKQRSPYGSFEVKITKEQLQGLLEGKMYVFTDEYSFIIGLGEEE